MCVGAALVLHLQYWFINETTYLLLHWKHSVTRMLVQRLIWLEIRYLTCAFRCFNRQQPRLYIKFIWNTRLSENLLFLFCFEIPAAVFIPSCSAYTRRHYIHPQVQCLVTVLLIYEINGAVFPGFTRLCKTGYMRRQIRASATSSAVDQLSPLMLDHRFTAGLHPAEPEGVKFNRMLPVSR